MNQKAVFFDRDGTLIREAHYLSKLEDIQLLPGAAECLRDLRAAGYFTALVTNQSGVARGYFPESFVQEAFEYLQELLKAEGAQLDAMAYCPHHLKGTLAPYNRDCDCRKPKPGMIQLLTQTHGLALEGSWVFGDRDCDVELAVNAGVNPALVLTGYGQGEQAKVLAQFPQTAVVEDLLAARDLVLGG
ncbi:MAG: HAD family hydrolase [bacterium]|nr:HAD family hydrolase [bacterium]